MQRLLQNEFFSLGLVFFLFPIAHFKITLFDLPLYLSEIPLLVAAGIIFWKARKEARDWKKLFNENKFFLFGITLFLLGAVLSYGMNEQMTTGLGMLKSFFFLPALLALLLAFTIKTRSEAEKILWLWLGGIAIIAWISLFSVTSGGWTYDARLRFLYESPNYLAMLVAPGIVFSVYFFSIFQGKLQKLGQVFFFVTIFSTLLLTRSYGALVSITLTTFLFLWLSRGILPLSLKKFFVASSLFLVALFALIGPTQKFLDLIQHDERSSLASREMIWTAALKIGTDHPVFGIGPGNFQAKYLEYQKYFPPYLEWAVPQPHNLYLALWLQTGVVGLMGFLLALFILLKGWKISWEQKNLSREERAQGALLLALVIFYLIYGLIDTPYFKNDLAFAVWGALGLLLAWGRRVRGSDDRASR